MHMQKSLDQMNLQLHHVLSDITGLSGQRILDAILAGEHDGPLLAHPQPDLLLWRAVDPWSHHMDGTAVAAGDFCGPDSAQVVRSRKEERVLTEKFGAAYLEYKQKTWF